jgi:hypothetical protein
MTEAELLNLPALSIRQPWAWLIVHGFKDWENRAWPTRYNARSMLENRAPLRCLIHASRAMTRQDYAEAFELTGIINGRRAMRDLAPIDLPSYEALRRECGGIVGVCTLVSFHLLPSAFATDWTTGPGIPITDASPLPFTPCHGRLGFFRPHFSHS